MGRPPKDVPSKKEHYIPFRVSDELYTLITTNAANTGLSISEYLRRCASGKPLPKRDIIFHDDTALVSELAKLNKLGNNLNQIARYFNEGGLMTNPLAKELHHALQEIDKLVIRCNEELEKEYGSH